MKTIQKWINESDVYMLILGGRYGSIDNESGLRYTELEYKYALSKDMPVFAIILEDSFLHLKAASHDSDAIFETSNSKKYEAFKEYVKTKIVKFSNNINQISTIVHSHLNEILNDPDYNLIGWIRGNQIHKSNTFYNEYPYDKLYQYLKELHSSLECLLLNAFTYRNKNPNFEEDLEKFSTKFHQLHSFYCINNLVITKYTNEIETICSYWDQLVEILLKVEHVQNHKLYPEDNTNLQKIFQSIYDILSKMLYTSPDSRC